MAETATVDNLDIQIAASSANAETSLDSLGKTLEEISDKLSKVTSVLKTQSKAAASNSKSVHTVSNAMSALSKSSGKAAKSLSNIPRAFGRIALYRTIRTIIKDIGAAIKEGLTNLKAYSQEVGTAFSPAVDNLRQHVMMLKNAFATALRPVIEALIPLIVQLVDWFSKLADFAAQVFSILTGKVDSNGRYTKAVLGDLEESNKKAKELRRTLLGFDEINRLDAPNNGSSDNNNATTMFTQADISDNAKEVAGRLKIIIDRIVEIGKKVKQIIADNPWILTLVEVLIGAGIAGGIMKKALEGILGVLHLILNPLNLVLAFLVASAMYGDKISDWIGKTKEKVIAFFDSVKSKIENWGFGTALVDAFKNVFDGVADLIGDISSLVYHLAHGDWNSALKYIKKIGFDVIKVLATLVISVVNIALGVFEDAVWAIAKLWTWLHNNVFAPVGDWIYTAIENVKIWFHNFGVNVKIAFVTFLKFLKERFVDAINSVLEIVNELIEVINWATGSQLKPIELKCDTTDLDAELIRLRDTKLPPITETVSVVGKWTQPTKPNFQIDTSSAVQKLNDLYNRVTNVAKKLSEIKSAAPNGTQMVSFGQFASGGYPSVGSIFVAGEAGAEWVGDINGRTGVMNTDQMANAVYEAVLAAMSSAPQSGGGDIYLDGEVIYRNVVRRNNNTVRSTGRAALLT